MQENHRMREQKKARRLAWMKWQPSFFVSINPFMIPLVMIGPSGQYRRHGPSPTLNPFMILLVMLGSTVLLYSSFAITRRLHTLSSTPAESRTVATNGTTLWLGDRTATAPSFNFPASSSPAISVSPLFERYYTSHSGATSLGIPVTDAFPTDQGWIQFFEWGALLSPLAQQKHSHASANPLANLIDTGIRDPSSGIKRLPLLQALLTVGSQVPIGGVGSPFTYVDLRQATNPALMLPAPSAPGRQDVFIKGGTRAGKNVGHLISQVVWRFINRPTISPDGWKMDFGDPLTEALSFTVRKEGSIHHLLVQIFWRDGVLLDQDSRDASGQPQIQRLDSGIAYLRTAGPPTVVVSPQQPTWALGKTTLLSAPGTGQAVAHVEQHFPLILLDNPSWNAGRLWYHVQWTAAKHTEAGWVEASAITFISPSKVAGWASFDALSPTLAAYLASIGSDVDAVVYDVTRQRYYTYHATAQFIMGSSMKVPIMFTFLDMTEREGREPNDKEMNLLTTMIENSNNDSASALYYGEIGGAAGVASYLRRIGTTGLDPNPNAWGYSLVTPLAMVNLLTLLHGGRILTAHDRRLALYLMGHIESDQQVGVGDTAPAGASVAMKDGWLPGPDGLWAMNSSGIVTLGQETYIIAVYTHEQPSLVDGQAIVRHICGTVASLLT